MEYETGAQTLLLLVMLKRKIRNRSSAMMGQQEKTHTHNEKSTLKNEAPHETNY